MMTRFIVGLLAATSLACGSSRSSGFGDTDGSTNGGNGDSGTINFGPDSASLGGDDGATQAPPGCSAAATFVYVVDVVGTMYKFDPPTGIFTTVGAVSCANGQAFSMSVDRNAVAWVLLQNGNLVK